MAFTLKKHTSNQLESARLNDVNQNWTDIETAIDALQTNASLPRGTLASCDLNTVKTPGSYYLSTSQTYTNTPPGVISGLLDVISAGAGSLQTAQRVIAWNNSYERISTSTQWSSWR
jgi:hypothetical protein